jgi:hypothetical protein
MANIAANTFTPVDETVVRCPKQNCTLSLSAMQQVGPTSVEGTAWAIVVQVDGAAIDNGPYQGQLSPTVFLVGNWQGQISVSRGKHTITWLTYADMSGYQLNEWSDTATVLVK